MIENLIVSVSLAGTVYFNAQHGCLKCCTVGVHSTFLRCTVFPDTNCEARTDQGFRERLYEGHYRYYEERRNGKLYKEPIVSPLLRLPINVIEQVTVSDSLHLLHLGIMKRLILAYKDGHNGCENMKWSKSTVNELTGIITRQHMPVEMHRAIRGIDIVNHWKASECAVFLNYIGVCVLDKFLSEDHFKMFLYLFCATTICSSGCYRRYLPVARKCFESFISLHLQLFKSAGSNVHNLIHVSSECEQFGELSSLSGYPFENHLYKIKNILRSGRCPLEQIANRLTEILFINENAYSKIPIQYPVFCNPMKLDSKKFTCVKIRDGLTLNNSYPNKWFLTKSKQIAAFKYFDQSGICAEKINGIQNVFEVPFESSLINVFKSCNLLNYSQPEIIQLNEVVCKFVVTNVGNEIFFIPLQHSLLN